MAKASASKKKKRGGTVQWIVLGLAAIMLSYVLKKGVALLIIGLMPSAVAYFVDETASRSWFRTVFFFNLAGVLPFVFDLFMISGNQPVAVEQQMSDANMWFIMYACAGMGWVTLWVCPQIISFGLRYYYRSRIEHHQKALKGIEEEYGIE